MKVEAHRTYYYPIGQYITICLAITMDGQHCARGMTIRSPLDEPNELTGQKQAYIYAMMGMGCSKNLRPIKNHRAIKILMEEECPFVLHGELDPVLTWHEVRRIRVKSPFHFTEQYYQMRFDKNPSTALGLKPSQGSLAEYTQKAMSVMYERMMSNMLPHMMPPDYLRCDIEYKPKLRFTTRGVVRKPESIFSGGGS